MDPTPPSPSEGHTDDHRLSRTPSSRALRSALKQVESLRRDNRRLVDAAGEPIAIVGMACRFPGGVRSPQDLWRLVAQERDAVGPLPTDRGWDLAGLDSFETGPAGRAVPRQGGFLDDAAGFDPAFFRISPADAIVFDPQQRILLEVAGAGGAGAGNPEASIRPSLRWPAAIECSSAAAPATTGPPRSVCSGRPRSPAACSPAGSPTPSA